MLPLSALLNPLPGMAGPDAPSQSDVIRLYDIKRELDNVLALTQGHQQVLVPGHIRDATKTLNAYLMESPITRPPPQPAFPTIPTENVINYCGRRASVEYNVKITRATWLEALHRYEVGTYVEYPSTSTAGTVGHLFKMDPHKEWVSPSAGFAYAQGVPSGSTGKRRPRCVEVLVDAEGKKVPCQVSYSTCQGIKICEFCNETATSGHCEASREGLKIRRQQELALQALYTAPEYALTTKTLAYFTALKTKGCQGPRHKETSTVASQNQAEWNSRVEDAYRGHLPKESCDGTLILDYDTKNRPFIRCEHYSRNRTVDHFTDYSIGREMFDTEYLIALFTDNRNIVEEIEENANIAGNGPASGCTTIVDSAAVRVNCPYDHRDNSGQLVIGKLCRLQCQSKIHIYEPLEEYRETCPFILVTCSGEHTHPIPLPSKTPRSIKRHLLELLYSMDQDLPDLTPRRFLRHPSTKVWLAEQLPSVANPTLSDLHISLANHDHIRSYITHAQTICFPLGTASGWEGLLAAKEEQDKTLPQHLQYIRFMRETHLDYNGEDVDHEELSTLGSDTPFRIVVCMTPESSKRLLSAQYIQCDIGFKRIAGFQEFELGGLEPISRTSIIFSRIYLNCQSAAAHKYVFDLIDQIVYQDTGEHLRWRHLHAQNMYDISAGILQVTADQHSGQAKGLGLHLKSRAQAVHQFDLHEPHRLLSFSEYDHLRRVFRLCTVYILRNIQKSKVPDNIKNMMRSLICVKHDNWEATINSIRSGGGKPASDWVDDKIRCKFAFPGMCWDLSFIPLNVWKVGDSNSNIIESLHSDANLECTSCSLLGGMKKGQYLDTLKQKDMKAFEDTGIRSSFKNGTWEESIRRGLKQKATAHNNSLASQDANITIHNKSLKKAHESTLQAHSRLEQTQSEAQMMRASQALSRAESTYQKRVSESLHLASKRWGSGHIGIMLPSTHSM